MRDNKPWTAAILLEQGALQPLPVFGMSRCPPDLDLLKVGSDRWKVDWKDLSSRGDPLATLPATRKELGKILLSTITLL